MKRKSTFIILAALLVANFSFVLRTDAQSENAGNALLSNMTVSVKSGFNYGFLAADYKSRFTDYRPGYCFGVGIDYYVMDWLAIGPEFWYMEHGGNNLPHTLIYADGSAALFLLDNVNLEIITLDIPVLATIHIPGMNGSFQPKIIVGPSFGYNFNATAINTRIIGGTETEVISKDDVTDLIKTWEYTATIGVGANIKAGSMVLSVDARYRGGMSNLHNVDNTEEFSSNTFILTLGLGF